MKYNNFIAWLYDRGIDVIRESAGTLNGEKVWAVVVDGLNSLDEKAILNLKKVVKIGECQYRYAPEIRYPVIYYKRG